MGQDITELLRKWEYDPSDNVRKIVAKDGKEKLQVRLPLGIEQYEVEGRPDGRRPSGHESYLDYYRELLKKHIAKHKGDTGFSLDSDACGHLTEEGILYYYRYVLFFQVQDYVNTIRDTDRNIRMFDFVKKYAASDGDRVALEQYRPYIIRMNTMAKALWSVKLREYDEALRYAAGGIEDIENLEEMDNPIFVYERNRSLKILRDLEKDIRKNKPLSAIERLERQLARAVRSENYERAAEIRDRIKAMRFRKKGS
jgi:hypothetical protein